MERDPVRLRAELIERFREQALFAEGYAPVYRRLFSAVAGWLAAGSDEEFAGWLITAAADRQPFDVTLLLPAAIHFDVLAAVPAAAPLAGYYPSVGGRAPDDDDPGFEAALRQVIHDRRDAIAAFIRTENVQTNETARGLAWLLPASVVGWPAIRLVELGASAGLNLVAERRSYRLVSETEPNAPLLDLGRADTPQFVTRIAGDLTLPFGPAELRLPEPIIRIAGDQKPFPLDSPQAETKLAAFIWPDQPTRLERLREGIRAVSAAAGDGEPVSVAPLHLPDELAEFMHRAVADGPTLPVIVYNTTMSMYLAGGATALRKAMSHWASSAAALDVPLLWLQWEPAHTGEEPPEPGWVAWTGDLWYRGRHHHARLAWVHPHGTRLRWDAAAAENLQILSKFDSLL